VPRDRSFLERLRNPEADRSRTLHENTNRLVDSVLANVRRLLNSRHGMAAIQDEYVIPDLSDLLHSFPEANARMRVAVKAAIEKYEPRLRRVSVKQANDPEDLFALRMEITAELVTEGTKMPVWFETRIDPSGEVLVKS
jgi:type VI secretion system protein